MEVVKPPAVIQELPSGVVQSMLFDKNIYSCADCIKYMILEGYFKFINYTITTQFLRFKFINPDETKYDYKMEMISTGIYYIYQYPKVSLLPK